MEYAIDIMVNSREYILPTLCTDDGQIMNEIDIGSGILLKPLFVSTHTNRAIGSSFDILPFVLSIPVGVATGLAANILYSWLCKYKVEKIIIEQNIIILTDKDMNKLNRYIEELLRRIG